MVEWISGKQIQFLKINIMGLHVNTGPWRIVGIKSKQDFWIGLLQEIYMDTLEEVILEKSYFSDDVKGGSSR